MGASVLSIYTTFIAVREEPVEFAPTSKYVYAHVVDFAYVCDIF